MRRSCTVARSGPMPMKTWTRLGQCVRVRGTRQSQRRGNRGKRQEARGKRLKAGFNGSTTVRSWKSCWTKSASSPKPGLQWVHDREVVEMACVLTRWHITPCNRVFERSNREAWTPPEHLPMRSRITPFLPRDASDYRVSSITPPLEPQNTVKRYARASEDYSTFPGIREPCSRHFPLVRGPR